MELDSTAKLVRAIKKYALRKVPLVVAFDGKSGVGKSTVTKNVADQLGAALIDQDDFYCGLPLDAWHSLTAQEKADVVIDWKRVRREVLEPLLAGKDARWNPFDWGKMSGLSTDIHAAAPANIIILDGVYSSRPELAGLVDVSVLVRLPEVVRMRHLQQREGKEALESEMQRIWDEAEEYFFAHTRPPDSFDIILTRRAD